MKTSTALAADWRAEADRLDAYLAAPQSPLPAYLAPGDRARIQTRALTLRETAARLERAE